MTAITNAIDPHSEPESPFANARLANALGDLCFVCGHSSAITDLAAKWEQAEDSKVVISKSPPSEELAEYRDSLGVVWDSGRDYCNQAKRAIDDGGAKGLDAATKPNAAGQPRSLQLGVKLGQAIGLFACLKGALRNPLYFSDNNVQELQNFGDWFGQVWEELGAVCETHWLEGLGADELGNDRGEPTEWWPASEFPQKLHPRMRQATRDIRKIKHVRSRMEDGVKFYSVADVRRYWPNEVD